MMRKALVLLTFAGPLLAGCGYGDPILVGAVLPLAGEMEYYGSSIRQGVELAFGELEAEVEYPYELELRVVDSQSDAATAAELLRALFEDKALVAIGGVTSAEALAMVHVSDRYDRFLVSPSATSPQLTGISSNFYRVIPSDFLGGTQMAGFAIQNQGSKTAAILAREEVYARGVQQVFHREFERLGGEVMDIIEYPPGTSDFTGLVERVMNLNPDCVYLAAYARDTAAMITGLRNAGYRGNVMTTEAFATPEIIAEVGAAANGVFFTQTAFDTQSDIPEVRAFVEAFEAEYGETPNLYSAHGYDAMRVVAETIRQSGRQPREFWLAIRGIRDFQGVTGPIQFDEKGDVQKFPRVYVIADGRLLDYETEVRERRQELMRRLEELRRRSEDS